MQHVLGEVAVINLFGWDWRLNEPLVFQDKVASSLVMLINCRTGEMKEEIAVYILV